MLFSSLWPHSQHGQSGCLWNISIKGLFPPNSQNLSQSPFVNRVSVSQWLCLYLDLCPKADWGRFWEHWGQRRRTGIFYCATFVFNPRHFHDATIEVRHVRNRPQLVQEVKAQIQTFTHHEPPAPANNLHKTDPTPTNTYLQMMIYLWRADRLHVCHRSSAGKTPGATNTYYLQIIYVIYVNRRCASEKPKPVSVPFLS